MLDKVIELAKQFGIVGGVKDALLKQPDKAAAKLADVLAEVVKTVEALDAEMVRYPSLHSHDDESMANGRSVLLVMEVGGHHQ